MSQPTNTWAQIYNIGQANAEITRLKLELASLDPSHAAEADNRQTVFKITEARDEIARLSGLLEKAESSGLAKRIGVNPLGVKQGARVHGTYGAIDVEVALKSGLAAQPSPGLIESTPGATPQSNQERLWSQYNSLPVEKRNDFYKENKAALTVQSPAPAAVGKTAEQVRRDQLWSRYNSIRSLNERNAFYQANRNEMREQE